METPGQAVGGEGHDGPGDCDELLDQLEDLLHGELDATRKAQLHAHLDGCPPCFERADFQAQLKALIASRCAEHPPSSLVDRVQAMLHDA